MLDRLTDRAVAPRSLRISSLRAEPPRPASSARILIAVACWDGATKKRRQAPSAVSTRALRDEQRHRTGARISATVPDLEPKRPQQPKDPSRVDSILIVCAPDQTQPAVDGTPRVEDVFKTAGVPTYTFVEPEEYNDLIVAIRTPGVSVVVEGPSGIGKTTAAYKALDALGMGDHVVRLNPRKPADRYYISGVRELGTGVYLIDDFHWLSEEVKADIADYMKVLADEEVRDVKLIVAGINKAGESLMSLAPDLSGRIKVIRFEPSEPAKIRALVEAGSAVLNIKLPAAEIAAESVGSFQVAQYLCHTMCVRASILERVPVLTTFRANQLTKVREAVVSELADRFAEIAMTFAAGLNFTREGRAPYLHILKWLGEADTWSLHLDRATTQHPEMANSVLSVLSGGHLTTFLQKNPALKDLIHFDERTHVVAVEDPKFYYYIKNLRWAKFAEMVGFIDIDVQNRYDYALSFAGANRDIAKRLHVELTDAQLSVFYDHNEQARLLGADVTEYLAPIYESEASFVICILGPDYPTRIWTQFESKAFKSRFGVESVIPIILKGVTITPFDPVDTTGCIFIDLDQDLDPQITSAVALLKQKIGDFRVRTPLPAGAFICHSCNLQRPFAELASGRRAICTECDEIRAARRA